MRLYLTSLCTHRNKWYIDISITFFFHRLWLCVRFRPVVSLSSLSLSSFNLSRCWWYGSLAFHVFLSLFSSSSSCLFVIVFVRVFCLLLFRFFRRLLWVRAIEFGFLLCDYVLLLFASGFARRTFDEWKFMQIKRIAVMNVLKIFRWKRFSEAR